MRLNKNRQLIQDLKFTDKYLAGKKNPSDDASRHPHRIEHLTQEQREEAGVDDGEEVHIMRILVNDLPKVLMVDLMKEAATGGGYQAGQETSRSGAQTLPPCLARAESNIWTSLQGRKDFHSRC